MMEDPYFDSLKDKRILKGIDNWKSGKYPTNL